MAPSSSYYNYYHALLPRQFGRPGDDDDNDDDDNISRPAIMGIVIGVAILITVVSLVIWFRVLRRGRRRRHAGNQSSVPLHMRGGAGPRSSSASSSSTHPASNLIQSSPYPYPSKPGSGGGSGGGYESTPDQNQSLLANAAAPGSVAWSHQSDQAGGLGVGSTQDGFGFTTANITRPASVVNFDVPPPRYEEAAGLGPSTHRPGGGGSGMTT